MGRRSRSEGEWKPRWATTLVGQDKERSHATSSARLPTMASSTRCFIEARVLASALQSRTLTICSPAITSRPVAPGITGAQRESTPASSAAPGRAAACNRM
eukprot:scaffold90315_cov47-Phaeocystis_antarctica.AAC.2